MFLKIDFTQNWTHDSFFARNRAPRVLCGAETMSLFSRIKGLAGKD